MWDLGLFGGPGLRYITSGYSPYQSDITGKLNFTLTAGLEIYRELWQNVDVGLRTGIDHTSNAGTGDRNTGHNQLFGLFTIKLGEKWK